MKKSIVILLAILVAAFFVGCGKENPEKINNSLTTVKRTVTVEETIPWGIEVLPDVFDNGRGSVYIRFLQSAHGINPEIATCNLLNCKDDWQRKFPNKRLISASIVYGLAEERWPAAYVVGMAICYEETSSE